MSTRRSFRRKVVLALHVVRRESGQKQLAHTLDVTEVSARLGGLNFLLEPGEVVEIKRGALRARFEVMWMGAPGSSLDGQAGIRSLEPGKSIWGVDLPADETDCAVDVSLRSSQPAVRSTSNLPAGKRHFERYPCSGSISIKTVGANYALHGEVKDISEGGIYVELTAPMAAGTEVTIGLKMEGIWIEFSGLVRTSYPLVGMGIAFHKLTDANREKLSALVNKLKQKASNVDSNFIVEIGPSAAAEAESHSSSRHPEMYSLRVLALACKALANNFEKLQDSHSTAEIEELRLAITLLQQKLSPSRQPELVDFLASLPSGTA
ncbi:MAG TPA: PilZ domain-containing protein [Candidatus Angelobacter sp.]